MKVKIDNQTNETIKYIGPGHPGPYGLDRKSGESIDTDYVDCEMKFIRKTGLNKEVMKFHMGKLGGRYVVNNTGIKLANGNYICAWNKIFGIGQNF